MERRWPKPKTPDGLQLCNDTAGGQREIHIPPGNGTAFRDLGADQTNPEPALSAGDRKHHGPRTEGYRRAMLVSQRPGERREAINDEMAIGPGNKFSGAVSLIHAACVWRGQPQRPTARTQATVGTRCYSSTRANRCSRSASFNKLVAMNGADGGFRGSKTSTIACQPRLRIDDRLLLRWLRGFRHDAALFGIQDERAQKV